MPRLKKQTHDVNIDGVDLHWKFTPPQQAAMLIRRGPRYDPNAPRYTRILYGGGVGSGKCLALDTNVPLADGTWKTMNQLTVGDALIGRDGKPTTVTHVFPINYDHPCYRLRFSNGAIIVADSEHLWPIYTDQQQTTHTNTTTEELAKLVDSGRVALVKKGQVVYQKASLPVHPYIYGYYLGMGLRLDDRLKVVDKDVVDRLVELHNRTSSCTDFKPYALHLHGLKTMLKKHKLTLRDRVDSRYMTGTVKQREFFIQGLMDACGGVEEDGSCYIVVRTTNVAKAVCSVLASLGEHARIDFSLAKLNTDQYGYGWKVMYKAANITPFLPSVNSELFAKKHVPTPPVIYVEKVEKVDSVPVRCIKVDAEDGIFLVTEHYIPTHNTVLLCRDLLVAGMIDYPGDHFLLVRYDLESLRREFWQRFVSLIPQHLIEMHNQSQRPMLKLKPPYNTVFHGVDGKGVGSVEKVWGFEFRGVYVDEAHQIDQEFFDLMQTRMRTGSESQSVKEGAGQDYHYMMFASNPADGYLKENFIDNPKPGYLYIRSTAHDNPFIDQKKYFEEGRQTFSEELFQRYYEGDWSIGSGYVYTEWKKGLHVSTADQRQLHNKLRVRLQALDWGYTNYSVILFGGVDPENRVVIYDEISVKEHTPEELIKLYDDKCSFYNIRKEDQQIYADPSIRKSERDGGSVLGDFEEIGAPVYEANNNRHGIYWVKSLMKNNKLLIHEACERLLWEIPRYKWASRGSQYLSSNNIPEIPRKKDDHALDSMRYLVNQSVYLCPEILSYDPSLLQPTREDILRFPNLAFRSLTPKDAAGKAIASYRPRFGEVL